MLASTRIISVQSVLLQREVKELPMRQRQRQTPTNGSRDRTLGRLGDMGRDCERMESCVFGGRGRKGSGPRQTRKECFRRVPKIAPSPPRQSRMDFARAFTCRAHLRVYELWNARTTRNGTNVSRRGSYYFPNADIDYGPFLHTGRITARKRLCDESGVTVPDFYYLLARRS